MVLDELEGYYDTVPRVSARAEDFGPLTLFVRNGPGPAFYARPTPGHRERLTLEHVEAVRARQRDLGVPESFEWVLENAPDMKPVLEKAGLRMAECPLLVLPADATVPTSTSARTLDADSPALAAALAVQRLAFAESGTARGAAGVLRLADEARKVAADGTLGRAQDRVRSGLTVFSAMLDEQDIVMSAGQHNPLGDLTEIVGVATLPARRRCGFGAALTAGLVVEARSRGIRTVFLSAADENVARIYRRLGFRRIGTALIVG